MKEQQSLISSAGVKMPALIYGTAWKKQRTAELILKAVRAGFRGIDTACQPKHYNEAQVGEAFIQLREEGVERESVFLQTKFTPLSAQDPKQIPYDKYAPIEVQIAQSFAASKENCQTDYIDSLILHSPITPHASLMQAWKAMEKIKRVGEARQLGISNCYDLSVLRSLYNDAKVKPAVLQNRFYRDTGYDRELREWCVDKGIIYQSFWSLTANTDILTSDRVVSIARKYKITEAQVFFRYLNQSRIVPLTGTTSIKHMQDDLGIFEFELANEDLKILDALLK